MRIKTTLLCICAAFFVAAPTAYAADSTQQGYGGVGGNTQTDVEPGGGGVGGETTATEPQGGTPSNGTASNENCADTASSNSGSGSSSNCTQTASAGSLPFTGQDLGLISLVGLMILLAGVGLRRLSRRDRSLA